LSRTFAKKLANAHKTIDFIDDLKSGLGFNRHTPSHGVWNWQKALMFDGFHALSLG
jgi:hypothetical protein